MSAELRFFEVGPRDGLQNEEQILDPDDRVTMIEGLVDAGVRDIEIGSFVHPRWVPQMAGTDEVAKRLVRRPDVRYWALVPNLEGLERAMAADVDCVAVFMSATESHNRKNLNRSVAESLASLKDVIQRACAGERTVRAYVSTAFGCPFEGEVDFERVIEIGEQLLQTGAEHLSLGDTIGVGHPRSIRRGCRRALDEFGADNVALHLHDTQGLAVANALVAFEEGVRIFDGAVGGMGGCPYAPGAAGNVASEELINLFDYLDAVSGVDADALCEVTRWLDEEMGFGVGARYYAYWRAQRGVEE